MIDGLKLAMTGDEPILLSDSALLEELVRAAASERRSTADLLALLAELDRRKLYLCRGYSSLFAYCTCALHLSEPAAYSRIAAARAARQFPLIFKLLADGDITLTTVTLLAARLTATNYEALLAAAKHKGKREVERLVAIVDPQLAVKSSVRRLPVTHNLRNTAVTSDAVQVIPADAQAMTAGAQATPTVSDCNTEGRPPRTLGIEPERPVLRMVSPGHALVAPISADQYLLKVTISGDARAKLDRIRDLLRHAVPNGDPAEIVERALTALLEKLEKSKYAATSRPRPTSKEVRRSRHVAAAVKRAVWARDEGRCAFIGSDGRCAETGFLEFHHLVPFAAGGPTTVENLELRCRAHNGYESGKFFGAATAARRRIRPPVRRTLSGQSSAPAIQSSG